MEEQKRSLKAKHRKKKIVPVIVTILTVAYYVFLFRMLIGSLSGILKYILAVVPLLLSAVIIYCLLQRIKEIDGGEEDDLSQY